MSITDEGVRFCLRNRVRIEGWAALRKEATAAVDAWLAGLDPTVSELATRLGAQVNLRLGPRRDAARSYNRITLISRPLAVTSASTLMRSGRSGCPLR